MTPTEHITLLTQITDALLSVCDGAQEKDGQGFNKPDSDTVRKAYPDMIPIAPLLLKYKKQIEAAGFDFSSLKEAVYVVSGELLTHNWNEHKLGFGKYSELTYKEMADHQRGYLSWMHRSFDHDDIRWIAANAVLSDMPIPELGPEPQDETTRLVRFEGGMIGVQAPYDSRDRCRALTERKWEKPYWVCPAAIVEEVAEAFPEAEMSSGFCGVLAKAKELADCSSQTTSAYTLKKFGNGKELMPFQKVGLAFAEATGGNCLIADEMGLGKSAEALAVIALHPERRPVVIVCPASLKLNWKKECEAWLETDDTIEVVQGGKVHELTADIVIINYDVLKKWLPELIRIKPQVLIADEAHNCKNQKSARSKAAKELAAEVPHKILLTGTPVLNRPAELWNQLQIIDPLTYSNRRFFAWHKRYTDAKQLHFGQRAVWDFSGASNLEDLAESLKTIMIRRTKDEVLQELPAKRRSTVLVPIDNRKEYDKADKAFLEWIAEQKGLTAAGRVSNVEQLAKVEYLRQIAIRGKMKQSLTWIENFLESGEKLLVFATHKATIHALEREYGAMAVKIDGSVSSEKRQEAVDKFQNNSDVKLFIGNIKAAGVGITLTAASNVAFLELDWTPALLEQAEDRCHRIGQDNAVNIYYLLAENTIDASIAAMLERKREVIDQITEDEAGQGFDLFGLVKEVQ